MSHELLLIAVLVLPFAGSCAAALFRANARNAEAYLSAAVALAGLALVGAAYPQVTDGGVIRYRAGWIPELGLDFSLRMDGLAWVFAMLVTGIGFLVVLYARYYMSPADPVPRFYLVSARIHGRDARHRAVGEPDPAGLLLGIDEPVLIPADRLLAPERAGARWRAHGPDHHVGRRALPVCRRV